ncbi:MAG TPA: hypothetical protein VF857_05765, partial [Spirochaetota bacterium]
MYETRALQKGKKSSHKKHHVAEWLISREMMDHAMRAIRTRIHIDRSYDIPYLAGYNLDGYTIFIDRHMP